MTKHGLTLSPVNVNLVTQPKVIWNLPQFCRHGIRAIRAELDGEFDTNPRLRPHKVRKRVPHWRGESPSAGAGRMEGLFWLSQEQLERIKPFFPKSRGVSRVDEARC